MGTMLLHVGRAPPHRSGRPRRHDPTPNSETFVTTLSSLRGAVRFGLTALALATLATGHARADVSTFTDTIEFLLASGATSATGALPTQACCTGSRAMGIVTVANPAGFAIDDYSIRLSGNEITINGLENLTVTFPHQVYAFGMDMVEPQFDPLVNAAFAESTFTFSLSLGGNAVGSYSFSPPNDTASFFGVWVDTPFDTVTITETAGGVENEFFGQMYASTSPNVPAVPEPENLALLGIGLLGLLARVSRHRTASRR